ncbi:MAG: tetratricopeptide repeat protein, partial [Elusimicrobia bacterium]|nr:tetratricopeptide repeat protein [Elusimicrobiota bacterium]
LLEFIFPDRFIPIKELMRAFKRGKPVFFAALAMCFLSLQAHGKSAKSYVYTGNEEYKKEHYGKALENYSKAMSVRSDNKTSYNIGNSLYKLGEYDKSRQFYEASAAEPKLKEWSHFNAGNSYFQQGNYNEAVNSYKKAILLNPGDKEAIHNLQLALERKNSQSCSKPDDKKQDKDKKEDKKEPEKQNQDNSGMAKEDAERIMQIAKEKEKSSSQSQQNANLKKTKAEQSQNYEDW